jgi:hypothetical protein
MPRSDDGQLTSSMDLTAVSAASAVAAPIAPSSIPDVYHQGATCTCQDFRLNHVCDHVLMAAAVRMVRRMIDVQKSH